MNAHDAFDLFSGGRSIEKAKPVLNCHLLWKRKDSMGHRRHRNSSTQRGTSIGVCGPVHCPIILLHPVSACNCYQCNATMKSRRADRRGSFQWIRLNGCCPICGQTCSRLNQDQYDHITVSAPMIARSGTLEHTDTARPWSLLVRRPAPSTACSCPTRPLPPVAAGSAARLRHTPRFRGLVAKGSGPSSCTVRKQAPKPWPSNRARIRKGLTQL